MKRREALLALMGTPFAQIEFKDWKFIRAKNVRWSLDGLEQFEVVYQGETIVIPIEEVFRALKGE